MRDSYIYLRRTRGHYYSVFRRRIRLLIIAGLVLIIVAAALFFDLKTSNKKTASPFSRVQNTEIANNLGVFGSTYFKFQDTGKWVFDTRDSSPSKFVYFKYRGLDLQAELTVYVNRVPIPLDLAVSRVLPVRIVNFNSLDITGVSDRCGKTYATGELRKVRLASIAGANMLCDPDTSLYSVVLAEIGGDYRLLMHRSDGTPVQFIIIFQDQTLDPKPDSVLKIAASFRAL